MTDFILSPINPDTPISIISSEVSTPVPDTPVYDRHIAAQTTVMSTVHSEQIAQAVEFHIAQTAISLENHNIENEGFYRVGDYDNDEKNQKKNKNRSLRPSTIVVHHDKYAQTANNSLANSSIDPWIAFTSTMHYVSALWLGPIGATIFFIVCTQWLSPEHWRLIYNTVWYSTYSYMIWYPFEILYKNVLFHSADGVTSTFTCCKTRNRLRDSNNSGDNGTSCCYCCCCRERKMTVTSLIRVVQITSVVFLLVLQLVKLYVLPILLLYNNDQDQNQNQKINPWWDVGIQCTTLIIFMIIHPLCMWKMIQTRQNLIFIRSSDVGRSKSLEINRHSYHSSSSSSKAAHSSSRPNFSFQFSSSHAHKPITLPPYHHVPLTTDADGNLMINTKQILKENNLSVTIQNGEVQIHKGRNQDALPKNVRKLRQYFNTDDYREIVEEQCLIRWNAVIVICFLAWMVMITLFMHNNTIFEYLMISGCTTLILLGLGVILCAPRPLTTFSVSDIIVFVIVIPFLPLLFAGYIWNLYIHNTQYALVLIMFLHLGHHVMDTFSEHLIERMSVKHLSTPLRYITKLIHHVYTYAVFGVTQWGWQFIAIVLVTNLHDFLEATGIYGEGLVKCCRKPHYPERHRLLLKLMSTAERMRLFYQLIVADVAGFVAVPLLFTAYSSNAASSESTSIVLGSWANELLKSGTMMESSYLVWQILLMIGVRIITSILAMIVFRWQIQKLQQEYENNNQQEQDENQQQQQQTNMIDRLKSYLVDTLHSEFYARVCIIRYESLYPELFRQGDTYQQPLWSHLYISTSMQDHVKYYFLCTLLVMMRLLQPLVQFFVL